MGEKDCCVTKDSKEKARVQREPREMKAAFVWEI